MPTIIKTVGPSGRDYTTIAAALASIPADVVASGNAYAIELDKAQVYPTFSVSGFTTNAACNITIRPMAGHSFRDVSGPLRYDSTKGVAIESSNGPIIAVTAPFTVLEGLQVKGTADNYGIDVSAGATDCTIAACLVDTVDACLNIPGPRPKIINNLLVVRSTAIFAAFLSTAPTVINNTIVVPSDIGTSTMRGIRMVDQEAIVRNNALFGFANPPYSSDAGTIQADGHNATSSASVPGAATGTLTGLVYADQFINTATATADFRLKDGSALINAGVTATETATSLNKVARTSYDIGAWEYASPHVRPASPLEINPTATAMVDALVFAFGTTGSMTSFGRLGLTASGTGITEQADSVTVTGVFGKTRLEIPANADHNSPVFTKVFVFEKPAGMVNPIFLFNTNNADTGGGYATGSLAITVNADGSFAVDRANQAAILVGPAGSFVDGINTLVLTRKADTSIAASANAGAVLTGAASDYTFGRNSFGCHDERDKDKTPLKLYWYAQSSQAATDQQLLDLSANPTMMTRTAGSGPADTAPPTFLSAVTNSGGDKVILTFNEPIGGDKASYAAASFSMPGHGAQAIEAGASSDQIVLANVSPPIINGESVSLTYTKPGTNPIVDTAGNEAASFGPVFITNNVPVRPVLPGYLVKVFGDGGIADFTTADALANYVANLNCATSATKVMVYLDKNLDAKNKNFNIGGSNNEYFLTMRPMPGKSFNELETDDAPGAIGTLGISVDCQDSGFSQGILLQDLRLNITVGGGDVGFGMNRNHGGQAGDSGGMERCRVLNTTGKQTTRGGFGNGTQTFADNLFVVDGDNGFPVLTNHGAQKCVRNTFVRLNAAVGYRGVQHDYGIRGDSDNVFAGCGSTPYNTNDGTVSNNFTDTPLAAAGTAGTAGVEYIAAPFFDSAANYRPAAGSGLLGRGSISAESKNDNNGNNRGPDPDPGAFQRVAAIPLPSGTITSQRTDGATRIIEMLTSGDPSAGSVMFLPSDPPNGAATVGPVPLVLDNAADTAYVEVDDIPPGDYKTSITLTNAGGVNSVPGGESFSIMNGGGLTYDTGGVGAGGEVPPPDLPAPLVFISTADDQIMNGKTGTLSGTANLQGAADGALRLYADPQNGGAAVDLGTITVNTGNWTKQFNPSKGLWKFRVVATANAKTAEALTGNVRVIGLVGNFTLPGV